MCTFIVRFFSTFLVHQFFSLTFRFFSIIPNLKYHSRIILIKAIILKNCTFRKITFKKSKLKKRRTKLDRVDIIKTQILLVFFLLDEQNA